MITYTKLKSGNWGIKGPESEIREGSSVTVHKKDGTTHAETVAKVVFRGDGIAIAAIAASNRPSGSASGTSGSRRSGGAVCADCGKPGKLVRDLEDGLLKHYRCCDIPPDGY